VNKQTNAKLILDDCYLFAMPFRQDIAQESGLRRWQATNERRRQANSLRERERERERERSKERNLASTQEACDDRDWHLGGLNIKKQVYL